MLSGIKVGKKKRKTGSNSQAKNNSASESSPPIAADNLAAADKLRWSLASDISDRYGNRTNQRLDLPHEALERRGRIKDFSLAGDAVGENQGNTVALSGKTGEISMDEELCRNVIRLGKNKRQKMSANIDSDEEEHRTINMMMATSTVSKSKQIKADEKAKRRAISRELALNDRQDSIASKCWWWLESSKFQKYRLLSLGNHVSLVMAPPNLSLTPGKNLYIVPITHSESLAGCEEEVWDEITRFQTALRNLFANEYNEGVLFSEIVLPSKQFWQTRMEVIPVKKKMWQDSELYFKSALTEQADEFGTHTKLMHTKGKGLRRTVPAKFPYFYIEWDAPNDGYAQIIENSASVSPDFFLDSVAGMAGLDPVRFNRKKKFSMEEERQSILQFLEKWKRYDWTNNLDG